jgi:hypothetical protein
VKQVREIYVNPTGYKTRAGDAYAQGSMFVMENWAVKTNADGTPATGADGKLIKDKIAKVFLMQKGPGFGSKVPQELKNGDWVFGSCARYQPLRNGLNDSGSFAVHSAAPPNGPPRLPQASGRPRIALDRLVEQPRCLAQA